MIFHILLGVWLFPAILAFPVILVAAMIKERSLFPFDEWFDPLILVVGLVLWPLLAGIGISEYRSERKKKLTEVQQAIDIHYRDKWYD